jgi:hypothetical protein
LTVVADIYFAFFGCLLLRISALYLLAVVGCCRSLLRVFLAVVGCCGSLLCVFWLLFVFCFAFVDVVDLYFAFFGCVLLFVADLYFALFGCCLLLWISTSRFLAVVCCGGSLLCVFWLLFVFCFVFVDVVHLYFALFGC